MAHPFFDPLMRWHWPAFGLQVPLFFPALSSLSAVCTADSAEAQRLVPDPRMRLVQVMPGRCLVAFSAVEYRSGDLGAYNELAVTLPIAFGERPLPALDALWHGVGGAVSAFAWQLAVTTERSRDVGIELAGYPKFMADVAFDREGAKVRCTVGQLGQMALRLTGDATDAPGERRLKMRSYTVKQGIPLVSTLLVRQLRYRDHLKRDTARLELGAGPIADALRRLKVSERPIASQACSQAEAMLFFPRNVMDD
jgi:hypothetical protein